MPKSAEKFCSVFSILTKNNVGFGTVKFVYTQMQRNSQKFKMLGKKCSNNFRRDKFED